MAVKAKLTLAGHKMLWKGETSLAGMSHDLEMLSDGKEVKGQLFGKKISGKEAPEDLGQLVVFGLSRFGIMPAFFTGAGNNLGKKGANVEELYQVSDFKLGDKRKIKGRPAQGIRFQIKVAGAAAFQAELYVDTETKVPLRRAMSTAQNGAKFSLVETYAIQLNPKVDDRQFERK